MGSTEEEPRLVLRGIPIPASPRTPAVMGVVNASPESFSDGGRYPTVDAQLRAPWSSSTRAPASST